MHIHTWWWTSCGGAWCPDLVCSARSVHRSAGPVSETQVTQVELAVTDKHTIIDNLAEAYSDLSNCYIWQLYSGPWPSDPLKKNSLISQQVQTSHSVQMLWLKVTLLCCVLGSCTCRQVCFSWRMNMDSGRLMLMWLTLNVNWSQKLTLTLIVGLLRPGKNLTDYGIVFTNIGI